MSTAPDATDIASLPLLPLDHGVVFPDMVVNLRLDTDESRSAVEAADDDGRELLLVPRIDGGFATVGTVARVEQTEDHDDGGRTAVVRGLSRARVGRGSIGAGPLEVEAIPLPAPDVGPGAAELADAYRKVATRLLSRIGGRRLAAALKDVDDPGALADTLGWWPSLSFERRVDLLETIDPEARIAKALDWVREADAEAEVDESVDRQVGEELDQGQREAILRRRMAAIRAELGEGDEDDLDEFRRRLAEDDLPDEVVAAVTKELDRLEQLGPQQMETSWIRTWIETVLDVPWGRPPKTPPISTAPGPFSTRTTPGWRRSRTDWSSSWPCASCAASGDATATTGGAGPSWPWWVPPGWARRRWASPWPGRWAASSCACPWAACGTRPRSGATAEPTSAPARAGS
jgi:ATP-dependent Lon protease